MVFCLFVCLFWVVRPTREFCTHLESSLVPVKGCIYELCSAFMAIEQWGFFSVPHLLWHGASVYDTHLRGPVTLKPVAESLAVDLSLPVLSTKVCRCWDSNIQPSACRANALTQYATVAAIHVFTSVVSWHA